VVIVTREGRESGLETSLSVEASHQGSSGGRRLLPALAWRRPWLPILVDSGGTAAGWPVPVRVIAEWDRLRQAAGPSARKMLEAAGGWAAAAWRDDVNGASVFPAGGTARLPAAMRSCCGASVKSRCGWSGCTRGPLSRREVPCFSRLQVQALLPR